MNATRARGFSLVELMIGLALGLIVLAALTTFFVSTSSNRHEIERSSRQIENGRFAIDALRNELYLAGFYAELQTTGATWQMPDPCETVLANLGFKLGPPVLVPLPITGYPAGGAVPPCVLNQVPDTDVLVVRRFNTEPTPQATPVPAQFYFQASRCATDSTTTPWAFDAGSNAGSFSLRKVNCTDRTDLYRYRVEIFYIRDHSVNPGDGVPTLVKLELDAGAINVIPMVEGIQDMRLEFGIDGDGDGTPNEYRRCDTKTPCTIDQWVNVTTVRTHILAVNLEDTMGYEDVKVYDMGSGDPRTVGPFKDKRKRSVYAAVITAPNRAGPRE